jgi:hypothetical protein
LKKLTTHARRTVSGLGSAPFLAFNPEVVSALHLTHDVRAGGAVRIIHPIRSPLVAGKCWGFAPARARLVASPKLVKIIRHYAHREQNSFSTGELANARGAH